MKLILKALAFTLVTATGAITTQTFAQDVNAKSNEAQGSDAGKGGGLISRNGRVMTFGTANTIVHLKPDNLELADIPALSKLHDAIKKKPFIFSDAVRLKLMNVILPTENRQYFKLEADRLDPNTKARLLEEYRRTVGIPESDLKIGAITDPRTKTTYLLPEFDELTETEQQAILLHENVWLAYPTFSYKDVVHVEVGFQSYLEKGINEPAKLYRLVQTFGDRAGTLKFVTELDMRSGALSDVLVKGKFLKISYLYGDEFLECISNGRVTCIPLLEANLKAIASERPKSALLRYLATEFSADRLNVLLSVDQFQEWSSGRLFYAIHISETEHDSIWHARDIPYEPGAAECSREYLAMIPIIRNEYAIKLDFNAFVGTTLGALPLYQLGSTLPTPPSKKVKGKAQTLSNPDVETLVTPVGIANR